VVKFILNARVKSGTQELRKEIGRWGFTNEDLLVVGGTFKPGR
jgi:hypothetical protein